MQTTKINLVVYIAKPSQDFSHWNKTNVEKNQIISAIYEYLSEYKWEKFMPFIGMHFFGR